MTKARYRGDSAPKKIMSQYDIFLFYMEVRSLVFNLYRSCIREFRLAIFDKHSFLWSLTFSFALSIPCETIFIIPCISIFITFLKFKTDENADHDFSQQQYLFLYISSKHITVVFFGVSLGLQIETKVYRL